jgi:hypothetical protein
MSTSRQPRPLLNGLVAGVLSTLATDLSMLALFAANGTPLGSFLRLIGSAALTPFQATNVPLLPVALAVDYGIGIITGIGFTLAIYRIPRLRLSSWPRAVFTGLIFGELLGSALYWIMVAVLQLPAAEALPLFGTASIFHLVWGVTLGLSARWLTRAAVSGKLGA